VPKLSAGLLLHRVRDGVVEVLIGHPGGPFWARKDDGAWSIPKGEYVDDEDPWETAQREFEEEVGLAPPHSNTFELEWPRGSGQVQVFAEVDRVDWFSVALARVKLLKGHRPFLDRLMAQPSLTGLREGS